MKKGKKAPAQPAVVTQPKKTGGPQIQFTLRDAQNMLAIARQSPMPNADEAEARLVLFQKYQQFMTVLFRAQVPSMLPEPAPVATPPAPVADGVKKALQNGG